MKNSNRINYLDTAKGIVIVLMIIGHGYSEGNGGYILKWIYSFHMPFFFIVTGVLYQNKKQINNHLILDVKDKFYKLMLPYIIWNSCYQFFLAVLAVIGGAPIRETFYMRLMMIFQLDGSAMWFLPVMFISSIVFLSVVNYRKIHIVLTVVALCSVYLISNFQNYFVSWWGMAIGRSAIGLAFIELGYWGVSIFQNKRQWFVFPYIVLILSFLSCFGNDTISIAALGTGDPSLMFIEAGCGTYLILYISKLLDKKMRIWGKIGYYSLVFLCCHGFVIQVIRLIDYKLTGDLLKSFAWGEGVIIAFLVVTCIYFCLPILCNYFGFAFGLKKGDR